MLHSHYHVPMLAGASASAGWCRAGAKRGSQGQRCGMGNGGVGWGSSWECLM